MSVTKYNIFRSVTAIWMGLLLGTSLPYHAYCPQIDHHATFVQAARCWNLMFHVPNNFGMIVPFLWQHLTCGIIFPMKSGPHLWLTISNIYWTHIFLHSSYNIVRCHEHSCGMTQYKSNDWLIYTDHAHPLVIPIMLPSLKYVGENLCRYCYHCVYFYHMPKATSLTWPQFLAKQSGYIIGKNTV